MPQPAPSPEAVDARTEGLAGFGRRLTRQVGHTQQALDAGSRTDTKRPTDKLKIARVKGQEYEVLSASIGSTHVLDEEVALLDRLLGAEIAALFNP
ncbi:MAG: hypothetical protein KGJ57_18580 [Sphingomonadales bacterium]|nr:hypothetical protein [Sphingomonadales bacterium]MDE2171404.1 hypothetical protein [Sphingomonadales bacterium]